jgi:protein-disulfide isomerase
MAKKTTKRIVWLVILLAVVYFGFQLFDKPVYDDPGTEKPVFGSPDSPVQIVEFSDLECPACKSAHPTVQRLKDTYGDQIGFQYYHFPLSSIHPFAQKAAEAVECANDQGAFWEYIDAAFVASPSLQPKNLKSIASDLGLNTELFNACLDSRAKRSVVQQNVQVGNTMDVRGTPTFFINRQKVDNWNYGNMAAIIDAQLG